jgi:hypothetical protein
LPRHLRKYRAQRRATAVEDFLQETKHSLWLIQVPGFFSLGVLFSPQLPDENEAFAKFLHLWDLPEEVRQYVQQLETARVQLLAACNIGCVAAYALRIAYVWDDPQHIRATVSTGGLLARRYSGCAASQSTSCAFQPAALAATSTAAIARAGSSARPETSMCG